MKTISKLFLPVFLVITTLVHVQAAQNPVLRDDARAIIHRTVDVIIEGQRNEARGRVYTGDYLSASIAHQHLAVRLFRQGQYERAIHQSIRARNLAFAVIRANRGVIRPEWQFDAREQGYVKRAPADADLDGEVRTGSIDVNLRDEKAAATPYADLDVDVAARPAPVQPAPPPPPQNPREDAKVIIHRTSGVIIEAQNDAARGRVYRGDLSASIAHQHLAVRLFRQGQFARAIGQSLRARNLAFAIIKANNNQIRAEWQFDAMEQGYLKSVAPDKDLDAEVRTGAVDANLNDEKAAGTRYNDLDIDVNVR